MGFSVNEGTLGGTSDEAPFMSLLSALTRISFPEPNP